MVVADARASANKPVTSRHRLVGRSCRSKFKVCAALFPPSYRRFQLLLRDSTTEDSQEIIAFGVTVQPLPSEAAGAKPAGTRRRNRSSGSSTPESPPATVPRAASR